MYNTELEEDFRTTRRLTRKEKRALHNNKNKKPANQQEKLNFTLKNIEPLTNNQSIAFDAYDEGKHLLLHGFPGTGKTFIGIYLALNHILSDDSVYKKLVIVRSTVSTRDAGFLPGDDKAKIKVYETPYQDICRKLFNRGDAYGYLKSKGLIEFISTAYIRGQTLENCIILVDEIANLTFHELDSVITRIGKNCRIIFSGDFRQTDFIFDKDKAGILKFMKILDSMRSFEFIDFKEEDIVRSGLVKSYIIAKMNFEDRGIEP